MIYVDSSSVCKSAVHSGFLNDNEGGEFMLIIANGEQQYESSNQNGVQSASFGSAARSFVIKEAAVVSNVDCKTAGNDPRLPGQEGTKHTIVCPADCTKTA